MAAVQVFNSGKARDKYLAAIVRATWKTLARADVSMVTTHAPGTSMEIPDSMSRFYLNEHHRQIALKHIDRLGVKKKCIRNYHFDFADFL